MHSTMRCIPKQLTCFSNVQQYCSMCNRNIHPQPKYIIVSEKLSTFPEDILKGKLQICFNNYKCRNVKNKVAPISFQDLMFYLRNPIILEHISMKKSQYLYFPCRLNKSMLLKVPILFIIKQLLGYRQSSLL